MEEITQIFGTLIALQCCWSHFDLYKIPCYNIVQCFEYAFRLIWLQCNPLYQDESVSTSINLVIYSPPGMKFHVKLTAIFAVSFVARATGYVMSHYSTSTTINMLMLKLNFAIYCEDSTWILTWNDDTSFHFKLDKHFLEMNQCYK